MHTSSAAAVIGLGSNLGIRENYLRDALSALEKSPLISNLRVSSFYETKPVDAGGDDFLNAVAVFETRLNAFDLHAVMKNIENAAGRQRPGKNAPRTLDLDLLFYDQTVIQKPDLQVPHVRLHERAFVLVPLNEIAPDFMHPVLKKNAAQMLETLSKNEIEGVRAYESC